MSSGTATTGMLEVALAPRRSLSPMDAPDRGRHSRRSLTPGDARGSRSRSASPYGDLSSKVALFNKQASDHLQSQAVNPFSGDGRTSPRPRLDKNDASYGKPVGKTALRGLKAQSQVSKEILELCEVIAENGESLSDGPGDDDPRVAISFGHLFHIYTYISNKVVGILLRARKQKLVDFEGETLFQKRDDHVPIIMLKTIQEIRDIFRSAEQKEKELRKQQERELYLQEHPEVLIEEEMRRAYEEELAAQQQEEEQQHGGSAAADQPQPQPQPPAIQFQLQVHEVADDDPSGTRSDSSAASRQLEGHSDQQSDGAVAGGQPGEEKPLEVAVQVLAPSTEQTKSEPNSAENNSERQPDKTPEPEGHHDDDLGRTALANSEQNQTREENPRREEVV